MKAAGYDKLNENYRYDLLLKQIIEYGAWNGLANTPRKSAEEAPIHEVFQWLDMENAERAVERNYLEAK